MCIVQLKDSFEIFDAILSQFWLVLFEVDRYEEVFDFWVALQLLGDHLLVFFLLILQSFGKIVLQFVGLLRQSRHEGLFLFGRLLLRWHSLSFLHVLHYHLIIASQRLVLGCRTPNSAFFVRCVRLTGTTFLLLQLHQQLHLFEFLLHFLVFKFEHLGRRESWERFNRASSLTFSLKLAQQPCLNLMHLNSCQFYC